MKRANVESKELFLPNKVVDSDGDGDENWKDDTIDAQIEESFEFYEDEGENIEKQKVNKENLEKIKQFQRKLGQSVIEALA
ncbi:MAG: hypothetical protein Q4A25_01695 [Candidatus Saccharibacteria bacterium]|nr:hypothetical protein [Candidatus Saccharibacteria bacterium]